VFFTLFIINLFLIAKTSLLALGGLVGFELAYDEVDWVEDILFQLSITILVEYFIIVLHDSLPDQSLDCFLGQT
jgi:hypothetical protein